MGGSAQAWLWRFRSCGEFRLRCKRSSGLAGWGSEFKLVVGGLRVFG